MSRIYELFGYPISDKSPKVQKMRKSAFCPFIGSQCDGGGNRFQSEIDLSSHKDLKKIFSRLERVPSGICSIQLSDDSSPWIICPRRLLYMGKNANERILHSTTQSKLLEICGCKKGTKIGIWTEVKIKYEQISKDDENAAFDYTFDYILMPLGKVKIEDAALQSDISQDNLKKRLTNGGMTFSMQNGNLFVEDFPVGEPVIVEVMTSSTSGGNKKKRSCIPQAFEDAMLEKPHIAPGINYRQVWARMASQLIVKSQAAIAWGGKTVWVLQDLLAEYISSSTALDLHNFVATHTNEVNILAFSYSKKYKNPKKTEIVAFDNSILYAGPIRNAGEKDIKPCFQDIVLASVCPPRKTLISALCKKPIANMLII